MGKWTKPKMFYQNEDGEWVEIESDVSVQIDFDKGTVDGDDNTIEWFGESPFEMSATIPPNIALKLLPLEVLGMMARDMMVEYTGYMASQGHYRYLQS